MTGRQIFLLASVGDEGERYPLSSYTDPIEAEFAVVEWEKRHGFNTAVVTPLTLFETTPKPVPVK